MPKIKDERILAHLSADQILDLITSEVHHLEKELDCGVGATRPPIRWREIDRRV